MNLFEKILYQPLLSTLIFIFNFLPIKDFGLSILILTFLIRLFLLPFTIKFQKSQEKILEFQKEIEKIKDQYKNKEEQAKALVSLYQQKKFNPFSGFFFFLIQIPILIALYRVFTQGIQTIGVKPLFLGFFDLAKPDFFLSFLAGFLQYFQNPPLKTLSQDRISKISNLIQKQTTFLISLVIFLSLLKFPSALAFYLISNSIFSIIFLKIWSKKMIYKK